MGTSRSAAEMSSKVISAARTIPRANREGTFEAALLVKDTFVDGIERAGGKPGDKWAGLRGGLGAGFNVKGWENATAIVQMRGPAQVLFFGAGRHFIVASGLGTRTTARRVQGRIGAMAAFGGSNRGAFGESRQAILARDAARTAKGRNVKSRKRALRTPQGLRAYAFHPGTTGNNQWPWTKRTAIAKAPERWHRAHRQALLRNFR